VTRSSEIHARKGLLVVAFAIVAALVLAACGSSSKTSSGGSASGSAGALATGKSDPNATLVVDASVPPVTLDPTESGNDIEIGWISSLYGSLTTAKPEPGPIAGVEQQVLNPKAVQPYLAESFEFSDNYKKLTLHLHAGMKFPNGDPVNSAAVKWSLERAIKVEGAGDYVLQEGQFKPALFSSIETPSETTVIINYSRPAPNQPSVLASNEDPIYDPKPIEENGGVHAGKVNTWLATHPDGYGPYVLKTYSPGHQMVLEANPNFIDPPKTKHVIINFIPSAETLLFDAKTGAADVTVGLSPEAVHSLTGNSCCTTVIGRSRRSIWTNIPKFGKVPVLDNQKSREALAYATPYEAILQKIGYGYGKTYFGEWMPSYSWYNPQVGKPHEFSITKAKELMKESGVKTPASLTIVVPIGETLVQEVATAMAGSWSEIGVEAKVKPVPLASFFETQKKYEDASVELEGPLVTAPAYFWSYSLQCEPKNMDGTSICLPEADKIMTEVQDGVYQNDPAKEQEILDHVDELYIKAVGRIWVYNTEFLSVLGKKVTGYHSSEIPEVRWWTKEE
jgi:peptide/nickel transport system substrate-binding protein